MHSDVIDTIERFRRHHALQEEREMENLLASPNRPVSSEAPDKNGIPQKGIFENKQVRVSTASIPKGTDWSPPHDRRDRIVVLLDKGTQLAEPNGKAPSFPSRVTWIPANSDVNVPNKSDQTKNLMILEFKDTAAEQALVTEASKLTAIA